METYRADLNVANDNRKTTRRRWFWGILAVLVIGLTSAFFAAKSYLFNGLPALPDKAAMWQMNMQPNMTLLDKDGNILSHRGPWFGKTQRIDELPAHLTNAFLAIEDQRFFEHPGVDRKAILRAFLANAKAGETVQGGSTLTQQLVKNMVLSPEQTYKRKFQEMWLSYEVEQTLTKPEILELYLNRIYLGNKAYGVEAASKRYFGKSAKDVTLAEASILAGLPKAPSRYDPSIYPDRARDRARLVLQNMLEAGMITPEQMADAENNPAELTSDALNATQDALYGYIFDYAGAQATSLSGGEAEDLIIQTSIDPKLQEEAQKALLATLNKSGTARKVSEGAVLTMDPETGAILAVVGGRDYAETKFNRAMQAKRQPGSSFKAFVYAVAMENGYSPSTIRDDAPVNINGWQPENYAKTYRGPLPLREAFKMSVNTVAAQVGAEVGPSKVVALAKRFGVKSDLGANYSIALGTSEVTLLDMVSAYSVFANEGIRREPWIISEIKNTAGDMVYTRPETAEARVYGEDHSRMMTAMLREVVDTGTGFGANMGEREAAGKTGTSQDHRDAWFVGFTAQYVTGVWMGNDDNSEMVKVTGGALPADAWKAYMTRIHRGKPVLPLKAPKRVSNDPHAKQVQAFYQVLAQAFDAERQAAGAGSTSGGQP